MEISPYRPMRNNPQMRRGLELLIKLLPDNLVGIEIGSYAGESAEIFAKSGKFKKLICVDPWEPDYYSGKQMVSAESQFDIVKEKYPCIQKMKGYSHEVISTITEKIDFIYIDGNHKRESVIRDIYISQQVLGNQGILAGHDYGYKKSPDVKPVIKELLGFIDAGFCDYSWIKFLGEVTI